MHRNTTAWIHALYNTVRRVGGGGGGGGGGGLARMKLARGRQSQQNRSFYRYLGMSNPHTPNLSDEQTEFLHCNNKQMR